MAPSPHSTRVAIINRSSSPTLLSAHNARSAVMNQQSASNHLSAYSTGPVIIGEQTAPGKLSAYNIRSDAMKQESASGKLSAYSAQSATMKQESASGKLSAYKISSVTRNRYSDVLHVGQFSISRDDECLDPDCSNFCQGPKDKSSKTELGCSEDDFSLNMDGVLNAFGPFGRGSLPTIPEYGTPTSNPSQAAAASLRDLGLNTSNPTISDPDLLIYPNLSKRVGRYFENRKPTPDGWTWSVADTPTTGSFTPTTSSFTPTTSSFTPSTSSFTPSTSSLTPTTSSFTPTTSSFTPTTSSFTPTTSSFTLTTGFYTPTQSTTSVALTDSSTVASGSVTELSQAGPSRPPTPQMALRQMALRQMDLLQMALHQVDDSQMGPFQIALHQIDDSQMALRHMDEAQIGNAQMGNRQMGNAQMGDPQIGPLTFGSGKHLHPIDVISKMREIQTEGVQPFGPSRFLNHPDGNPTGNPNGNYLGTMSAASNQMTSLPDHLNTCIWVEGAPADLTYFEMLRSIRHCGKVYSVHINPPREKHFTAAAKIAFCTRVGAERFFQQAHSAIGIIIRGRRICVRWNRNKYRENFNRAESRVLRISGPSTYVNFQVLGEYFAGLFYFNLIWVEELSPGNMIWEFSSILAQAHSAKQAIEREPAMMNMVRIKYERDPCE